MKTAPKSTEASFPTDVPGRLVGVLFLALIPLVTLVPYAGVSISLTQNLVLRWVSAAVFLICLGVFLQPSGKIRSLRVDFPNLLLLLLSAWVLLSVKNSKEAFVSFYSFRGFLALVLWWFSLRMAWQKWPGLYPAFEKTFRWTAYFVAAWLCFYMAGRFLGIPFFLAFIERKGSFLNENIGAGFLGMGLLWMILRKLHGQAASGWGLALLFVAWAITQSRGAFVAMVVVILLYLLLHMKEFEEKMSAWKTSQWVLFGAAVLVVLACSSYTIRKLFDALEVDPRALNRWELWKSGFDMAMTQPLLGFGPGTFADVFPSYQPAAFWNAFVPAVHNEYLQTTIECGFPALLLTLLFLWYVLRETGQRVLQTPTFKQVPPEDMVSEYAFYLVILEALHNFVDFTFHEWCHRLVLLGFVTFALSRRRVAGDVEVSLDLSRRAYLTGAGVLGVFIVWALGLGGYKDFVAKIYNFNANLAYQQQELDSAEFFSNKSLSMRSDFMEPWDLLGAVADVHGERSASSPEKRKYFETAEQYYQKASQASPYSLAPLENRVHLMMVQRRLDEALDLQKELVEKAPQNPQVYVDQSDILLAMGRIQEAIISAQKAIDLDYAYVPGYLRKARAMEALGKNQDAIQVYKAIEDILKKIDKAGLADKIQQLDSYIQNLQG